MLEMFSPVFSAVGTTLYCTEVDAVDEEIFSSDIGNVDVEKIISDSEEVEVDEVDVEFIEFSESLSIASSNFLSPTMKLPSPT